MWVQSNYFLQFCSASRTLRGDTVARDGGAGGGVAGDRHKTEGDLDLVSAGGVAGLGLNTNNYYNAINVLLLMQLK